MLPSILPSWPSEGGGGHWTGSCCRSYPYEPLLSRYRKNRDSALILALMGGDFHPHRLAVKCVDSVPHCESLLPPEVLPLHHSLKLSNFLCLKILEFGAAASWVWSCRGWGIDQLPGTGGSRRLAFCRVGAGILSLWTQRGHNHQAGGGARVTASWSHSLFALRQLPRNMALTQKHFHSQHFF